MSNSHGVADFAYELQATSSDLLPACIVSTTFPAVPAPPSLTLAAFATAGYVKDGPTLVYVTQEAHTITLTGGDGNYWLALGHDTWATVAAWNRTPATHYLWRPSATEPPSVDGVLVWCQVAVSGGAITAVTPLTKVTSQPMSKQNANAVVITGGYATLASLGVDSPTLLVDNNSHTVGIGSAPQSVEKLAVGGRTFLNGTVGMGGLRPDVGNTLTLNYNRAAFQGIMITPSADTGPGCAMWLTNAANSAAVGSISTTASATAFNTSSDSRLKHAITPLTAALDRVRALRPVQFLWKSDDAPGVGFIASEVAQVVEGVITGEADAVDEAGHIVPQQIDHSKLVPWLTAALKETLAQVEALTARVAALEAAQA